MTDPLSLAREVGAAFSYTEQDGKVAAVRLTADQLTEYTRRVRAQAMEECAELCDAIETQHWNDFKGRYIGAHPRPDTRGNPYTDGQAGGAADCAASIRSLAKKGE